MAEQHVRTLVLTSLVAVAALLTARVNYAEEARTPDATITVSSSTAASALGFTLVEGVLRHRDKVYRLALRGAQPTADSTGMVYGLGQARDIEGSYKAAKDGLRNERGVTIVFDPPLDLPGGSTSSRRQQPRLSEGLGRAAWDDRLDPVSQMWLQLLARRQESPAQGVRCLHGRGTICDPTDASHRLRQATLS